LVCLDQRTLFEGCDGELQRHFSSLVPPAPGRLLLITPSSGTSRQIARGLFGFADWSPTGNRFAYATSSGLYIADADGAPHKITSAPAGGWAPAGPAVSECRWLGWSPDGSYIALQRAGRLEVIDAATGQTHPIYEGDGNRTFAAAWWEGGATL
jgi:Tol biopolymer transport system component